MPVGEAGLNNFIRTNTTIALRSIFKPKYVFHLLFWLMYAVLMILEMKEYAKLRGWLFCILPLSQFFALMAVIVYVNVMVLIPLLLEKKKVFLYITGILLLMVLYTMGRTTIQWYWDNLVWPQEPMEFSIYYFWNAIYAVWFAIISSMLFFTHKWYDQRQQVKNIQITQLETELKYLRAQVNPHFLFNGLNTIYGSIHRSNQQARDILVQFSDLLRYNLYEADVDWVDLGKEALYLQNYVALQRARSNSNLQIELTIEIADNNIQIAPLIFIAFVENAFKFSSQDDNRINTIRIRLWQQGKRILFECENSYEKEELPAGGIGVTNTRRRLELLYKDRYTLTVNKDTYTYFVQLMINV